MSTHQAAATEHAAGPDAEPIGPPDPDRSARRARWAAIAFGIYLVIAFFYLLHQGRHYWFYQDEWNMILRPVNLGMLLRPLNQHWVTLPFLLYHVLFWLFGLNYAPYQICAIGLHLSLVVLLRVVMRRAGVGPWFATITAGIFVIYGAGSLNILQSIQMCLVGSVVFGVLHLLCADHDGPFDRRDALGLLFGAIALMFSGIGTPMILIVGLAVLVRRGWRMALLHTVPLVALNALWYVSQHRYVTSTRASNPLKYAWEWNTSGIRAVFMALGRYPVVAFALGAVLVVGLVLAWRPLTRAELRKQASVPAAMLLGVPMTLALVSTQRYMLPEADSSKFIHISTALTLPALAIAAQAIARRWRWMAPVVLVLLLIGVPNNIRNFTGDGIFPAGFFANEKAMMLGAAYSPLATQVPARLGVFTDPYGATGVKLGWLLEARKAGRLPSAPSLTPSEQNELLIRMAVDQTYVPLPNSDSCRRYAGPFPLVLFPAKGETFAFNQTIVVRNRSATGHPHWATVYYNPVANTAKWLVFNVELPHVRLYVSRFYTYLPKTSFVYCRAKSALAPKRAAKG